MNTHLANISSLSTFGAGTGAATGTAGQKPGLLARAMHWLVQAARQRREQAELAQFSDRELADIGLSRGDLDRIQNADFAMDYHQGRNSAMFLIRA